MNVEIKQNLWQKGKSETKKFYKIKLSKKANFISFFLGLLIAAVIVFPFACLTFEIVELYWYNQKSMVIFLAIAWGLLMVANGLSNFYTVKICKAMIKEMDDLQKINEYAILLYQTFNIGFGLFIFAILLFFGVSAL